jgi:Lysylphosphatidylglycerol synthase TM region
VSELPSGRPPARHYRATLAGGADLFVKVLDDDARTRDLLARTWQRIRLRAVGDEQPVGSLRQAVEHEAFVALWAHRSGVRTPDVVAVQSVGRRGMLIAQRFVDGTPLDAVAPARIDSALVAAWRSLASLHGAGIARGPLDAPDFLVDAGEELWLVDMDHAGLGAPPGRMARDRADLLTSTAMAVGPDRAIAAASTGLGPIDLPFAQAGALYLGGSTIGDAVPVPGGLGATDAALIAGLAGAGVELAIATSCVLVYRLISYWLVIAPGWVCLEALRRLDYV